MCMISGIGSSIWQGELDPSVLLALSPLPTFSPPCLLLSVDKTSCAQIYYSHYSWAILDDGKKNFNHCVSDTGFVLLETRRATLSRQCKKASKYSEFKLHLAMDVVKKYTMECIPCSTSCIYKD